MDEAEKYKQRLEAIAEKRRLQDEEEKARREMEDEKLRLQQLKRKSLRDQWLMEAAPLSPTSVDAQAPRSPSWNTQAQDMTKDTDKLQLAEEPEEPTEAGQMEVGTVAEDAKEMVPSVVRNGQNSNGPGGHEETAEGEVKVIPRPALDETSISGNVEPNANHSVSVQNGQSTTNGLIGITTAVGDMKLDQQSRLDEPEPGQAQNDIVNDEEEEEEEEGTLVTRAECVIITDEGDDASQEDHQDDVQQQDETPLVNVKEDREEEEAVEELAKTKIFPGSGKNEAAVLSPEAQPAAENGDIEGSEKLITNGEGTVEHEDIQVGNSASVQLQFSASPPEGTVETLVPVYSEGQPSVLSPLPQAQGEASASAAPEGAEAALQAEALVHQPGQFQDVSLADPQGNNCTEEGPREQEPLLSRTTAQPAGIPRPASSETQSPPRAHGPADEAKEPKRKNCSCCSVM